MFTHFYNQRVRKSVAVFGSLFNNINIVRKSKGSDQVYSQVKAPLSYAPKRKFLERIEAMSNGEDAERQLALRLPRMSFEMLAMNYDPNRQLPKINNWKAEIPSDGDKRYKYFVGTPYVLNFQLNVFAENQDDALQIVEQILPYFNPQYTLTIKPYDGVDSITEDVPIILTNVSFSDDFEGNIEQRRVILYTLDFEMKMGFYGPSPSLTGGSSGIIEQIDINMYNMDAGDRDSDEFLYALSFTPSPPGVSQDSDWTLACVKLDSAQP
jgi:hypothetical protein